MKISPDFRSSCKSAEVDCFEISKMLLQTDVIVNIGNNSSTLKTVRITELLKIE
jgi:hypothetical protein